MAPVLVHGALGLGAVQALRAFGKMKTRSNVASLESVGTSACHVATALPHMDPHTPSIGAAKRATSSWTRLAPNRTIFSFSHLQVKPLLTPEHVPCLNCPGGHTLLSHFVHTCAETRQREISTRAGCLI